MNQSTFKILLVLLGAGFAVALIILCVPPMVAHPDLLGAITAGFVNPYASAYALDAVCCWFVLAVWVIYEARTKRIRHGWVALALGVVPGVTTGLAVYLLIRLRQDSETNTRFKDDRTNTPTIAKSSTPGKPPRP